MEGLFSVICMQICIIFLAALTHASLQLGFGSLLLLYHESLGKHIKKKTKNLVLNYILGSALLICLFTSTFTLLISTITESSLPTSMLIATCSILLALAAITWLFYYKASRSTELWIPRAVSKYINFRAKFTESNTESFSLGMLTAFAEMPFSIILMIIAGNSVVLLPQGFQFIAILGYVFIAVLPLFLLRFCIRRGKTVVDIQKWRVRNKGFMKVLTSLLFITLALFILGFRVLGG